MEKVLGWQRDGGVGSEDAPPTIPQQPGRLAQPDPAPATFAQLAYDVALMKGQIRALELALKQVEDAAIDYYERSQRIRQSAQRERAEMDKRNAEQNAFDWNRSAVPPNELGPVGGVK